MQYSKEEKLNWISSWKESGKKAWTYAKEKGLSPRTFMKWVKAETKQNPDFIEVNPKLISLQQSSDIIIEKGDVRIRLGLGHGTGLGELKAVIEVLAALP